MGSTFTSSAIQSQFDLIIDAATPQTYQWDVEDSVSETISTSDGSSHYCPRTYYKVTTQPWISIDSSTGLISLDTNDVSLVCTTETVTVGVSLDADSSETTEE